MEQELDAPVSWLEWVLVPLSVQGVSGPGQMGVEFVPESIPR